MRLFVSINFTPEITEKIHKCALAIGEQARSANVSRKENIHLTLAFIGETTDIAKAKKFLDAVSFSPFEITLSECGKFGRPGEDIHWIGCKKSAELCDLAYSVRDNLIKSGFDIDTKPFKPHITLARQVVSDAPVVIDVPKLSYKVEKISLMKLERINGKLTYTEIHSKKAEQ